MLEGAARHHIQILTDGIVFASRDDGMVANTGVAGFAKITYDQLARGAVVGFIYISGFGIPSGFYRVYVILPLGASHGTAYLLDESGRAVITGPVTPSEPAPKPNPTFTNGVGASTTEVDYHRGSAIGGGFICIRVELGITDS